MSETIDVEFEVVEEADFMLNEELDEIRNLCLETIQNLTNFMEDPSKYKDILPECVENIIMLEEMMVEQEDELDDSQDIGALLVQEGINRLKDFIGQQLGGRN